MSQATFEQVRSNHVRLTEGVTDDRDPRLLRTSRAILEQVGLLDAKGKYFRRADGFPYLNPDRKRTVADFPLAMLAEAIMGRGWERAIGGSRWVQEEAVAPIGPSFFANVNAYLPTVSGLVQAALLEGYETTPPDLVDLFPSVPYAPPEPWTGGDRWPAIIGPAKPAPKVGPGESHPDLRMDAMYVQKGPMAKYGGKLSLAMETAATDITNGEIIAQAREGGETIKLRMNEIALDGLCGQMNNFALGLTNDAVAVPYNTYGATVPTGNGATGALGNDIVNPMTDPFSAVNTSDTALAKYHHPVTGLTMPMAGRLNTIVLPSTLAAYYQVLTGVTSFAIGSQPGLPVPQISGSTFPTATFSGPNPLAGKFPTVRVSQWLYDRHTKSTTQTDPELSPGLGLNDDLAKRWYRLDPARFAKWRIGWPFKTYPVSPQSFTYADQGLAFCEVFDAAFMLQIINPWAVQRNKRAETMSKSGKKTDDRPEPVAVSPPPVPDAAGERTADVPPAAQLPAPPDQGPGDRPAPPAAGEAIAAADAELVRLRARVAELEAKYEPKAAPVSDDDRPKKKFAVSFPGTHLAGDTVEAADEAAAERAYLAKHGVTHAPVPATVTPAG